MPDPTPPPVDEIIKQFRANAGSTKDSDFYRAFEYFVSKEGIYGKTRITPAQRSMLFVFKMYEKKYPSLKDAGEVLAQLFISEDGEHNSRRGMVELFKGLLHHRQQDLSGNMEGVGGADSSIKGR